LNIYRDCRGRDSMLVWFTTTYTISTIESLLANVVSSNPAHGGVYSIQHYVIKFVSDFATGQWFSPGTPLSSTNKTDRHDIIYITLLKVALNTIILPPLSVVNQSFEYTYIYLFSQNAVKDCKPTKHLLETINWFKHILLWKLQNGLWPHGAI
jgi:hypothetical protein